MSKLRGIASRCLIEKSFRTKGGSYGSKINIKKKNNNP